MSGGTLGDVPILQGLIGGMALLGLKYGLSCVLRYGFPGQGM